MAKYGQAKYGEAKYGKSWCPDAESINGVWIGYGIRKQLGKTWIFRVVSGNGYFGTEIGKHYQQKYAYFVPSSINNIEGQPSRNAFATANSNWKNVLTAAERKVYNDRAARRGGVMGRNLYIGEYVEANA
jgi:hypothetical protein